MAENSMGGTELLTMELFKRLPDEYKDYFQFVVSRVHELEEKPRLYWIHDLALDPVHSFLTEPDGMSKFEKLIFVSHWQQQQFNTLLNIPYSEGMVIKNAIDPIEKHDKLNPAGPLQLIYCSTPQRGLDVLLGALDMLDRDDWHLHVYSSYGLYGWKDNDKPFEKLFDKIEEHPNMTNYGAVPYDELREAWKKMHILAYPSTWQETSCRVAMEAMSAHCAVVTSNWGALPETVGEYGYMYSYTEHKADHAERFADMLEDVMDDYWYDKTQKNLDNAQDYAYNHYSWSKRIEQWTNFLDNLQYEIENG
jgi:glycosyltransferase involved in cell wall biosynthesis